HIRRADLLPGCRSQRATGGCHQDAAVEPDDFDGATGRAAQEVGRQARHLSDAASRADAFSAVSISRNPGHLGYRCAVRRRDGNLQRGVRSDGRRGAPCGGNRHRQGPQFVLRRTTALEGDGAQPAQVDLPEDRDQPPGATGGDVLDPRPEE
ncbi:hypothetical protein CSC81_18335, partial [Tenacibaculum discolor]